MYIITRDSNQTEYSYKDAANLEPFESEHPIYLSKINADLKLQTFQKYQKAYHIENTYRVARTTYGARMSAETTDSFIKSYCKLFYDNIAVGEYSIMNETHHTYNHRIDFFQAVKSFSFISSFPYPNVYETLVLIEHVMKTDEIIDNYIYKVK